MYSILMACITNGSKGLFEPKPDPEHLTVLLLQDVAPQVVSPNLRQFSTKLTSLVTSIDHHIQVLQDSTIDAEELTMLLSCSLHGYDAKRFLYAHQFG